ncbi:Retrovirus-related Pol polyprotein from transposon TNT 1-94 [Gossypium australe]|uniref:Retrovirus-related Pol polyprotein from transposon TNT 1-94 n=1 Tax=Gossypium australe TaxID=47621 RepID=A0A5B6W8P8_9ROSI|nr:Retrovirus-related Pol polyprotein from transposon TNT 1-94 [Gossypium australe]
MEEDAIREGCQGGIEILKHGSRDTPDSAEVIIILAGLPIEFESIRVLASATPMNLNLVTELLLDCEARQMALLQEEPLQANLCQLCGKIGHMVQACYHQFDENFSGPGSSSSVSVNYHRFNDSPISHCSSTRCCDSFLQSSSVSSHPSSRASSPSLPTQMWYPDSGATNHITPTMVNLTNTSPYTGQFAKDNSVYFEFHHFLCFVKDIWTGKILLEGLMHNGLYKFDFSRALVHKSTSASILESPLLNTVQATSSFALWHNRLGHPCRDTLAHVLRSCNVNFKYSNLHLPCTPCKLGKSHKLPFNSSKTVYSFPFELMVSDVWGPAHVLSSGYSYYVSFIDMYSRYTWLYFLKNKSEVLRCYLHFHNMIQVQFGKSIKMLQMDWGVNIVPCLLSSLNLVLDIGSLVLIPQNKMELPTPVLQNQSPFEKLYNVQPDYSQLRVFGSACFPYLRPFQQHKLQLVPLHHQLRLLTDSVINVHMFLWSLLVPYVLVTLPLHQFHIQFSQKGILMRMLVPYPHLGSDASSSSARVPNDVPAPFSSVNCHPMLTRSKHGIFKPKMFSTILDEKEPLTIIEAFKSSTWTVAAQAEYAASIANNTWDLVPLPAGRRAVGYKWIFKIKRHADGSIARYKGRLVVKGYLQEAGVDFLETFSPVVKPTTIGVILALVVSLGWSLRQVDINNAFLNGDLREEIYMIQPPGFEQQRSDGKQLVCRLRKALYGSQLLYALVYVNNIIITGNDSLCIDQFVKELDMQFSLKDLGQLHYFLGIEVTRTPNGLFLSQKKYILELLQRASMYRSKPSPTPMMTSCKLSTHQGNPIEDESLYRSIVGALQYVVITRPDIAFSVNKACQFMHKPLDTHFKAVKQILRYLQGTLDLGLQFHRSSKFLLEGYSDASGGRILMIPVNLEVVLRSTAEAEYRSLAHVTAEIVWLQSLLTELGVSTQNKALVWCDSSTVVAVVSNPVMHSKFKHVDLDLFFVREKVVEGSLQVGHVSSQDQIADVLTKPLSVGLFDKFRSRLIVISIMSADMQKHKKQISTGHVKE